MEEKVAHKIHTPTEEAACLHWKYFKKW